MSWSWTWRVSCLLDQLIWLELLFCLVICVNNPNTIRHAIIASIRHWFPTKSMPFTHLSQPILLCWPLVQNHERCNSTLKDNTSTLQGSREFFSFEAYIGWDNEVHSSLGARSYGFRKDHFTKYAALQCRKCRSRNGRRFQLTKLRQRG